MHDTDWRRGRGRNGSDDRVLPSPSRLLPAAFLVAGLELVPFPARDKQNYGKIRFVRRMGVWVPEQPTLLS